jgi:hypothetical protein
MHGYNSIRLKKNIFIAAILSFNMLQNYYPKKKLNICPRYIIIQHLRAIRLSVVSCHMCQVVSCHVSSRVVSCHGMSCQVVLYQVVSCHVISCRYQVVSCGVVPYRIVTLNIVHPLTYSRIRQIVTTAGRE